jgi:general secretion pathway protein G
VRPSLTFWFGLAILGIVLLYTFIPRSHNAHVKINQHRYDIMGGIKSALGQYKVDIGYYPKSFQDLVQKPNDAANWHGPYLDSPKLAVDPWGNEYIYEFPGKHNPGAYDLMSAGPDGKKGTEDDIVNWDK